MNSVVLLKTLEQVEEKEYTRRKKTEEEEKHGGKERRQERESVESRLHKVIFAFSSVASFQSYANVSLISTLRI